MISKNIKLKAFIFSLILILALAVSYKLFIEDKVVAVVEGEEIRRSQLDEFLQVVKLYFPDLEDAFKDKEEKAYIEQYYLDFLVGNILIKNDVDKLELEVTEAALDTSLKDSRNYFINDVYESEESYQQRLTELKISDAQLDELAYSEVAGQVLYEHVKQGVTEEDVRAYADENPLLLVKEAGYVATSHILVETEDEARDVYGRLIEGNEDFTALAKEISLDPSVEENGGYIGEVHADDTNWDQAFLAGALALEAGEISEPVQSAHGWHVIKAGEKTETVYYEFEEVKQQVRIAKEQEVFSLYVEDLWDKADLEVTL